MKLWLRWTIIIAIGVVLFFLITKVNQCGNNESLRIEEKRHKEVVKKISGEKDRVTIERDAARSEIDKLLDTLEAEKQKREEREKIIKDIQGKIPEVPKRTGPFPDLKSCENHVVLLQAQNDGLKTLNIELKLQLSSHESDEKIMGRLKVTISDLRAANNRIEAKYNDLLEEHESHQRATKKLRSPGWLHFGVGVYFDPLRGTSGLAIQLGIRLDGILKLLF